MAELPFVDTHFHLHDMKHPKLRYAWLEPEAVHGFLPDTDPLKAQRYRIKDYLAEIRFAHVSKAIHVQAAVNTPDPVDETEWLQAFADETGFPQGIVAECHLAGPDVAQVLDRHMAYANVRGIRNFGEGRYLVDPAWRRGFAELAPRNLVSCIDTRVELAPDLTDLARAFPATAICVDHCAVPMRRDPESFRQWRAAMSEMAKPPNVTMKISGLGMCDPRWTVTSIRAYVIGAIEAFGVDRVVFGTNWPVDRMYSSYPDVVNAYAEIISSFTREEKTKMFSGNAERIFRI
jgi:predicted TIM-barrel fold metal-dependent hydrolase